MSRTVRPTPSARQTKGIHGAAEEPLASPAACPRESGGVSTALSPTAEVEAGQSLARALRVSKAETIGEALSVGRSRVYELAAHPDHISLGMLAGIARFDPDPDALVRIAHALLVQAAGLAAERRAYGEVAVRLRLSHPNQPRLPWEATP